MVLQLKYSFLLTVLIFILASSCETKKEKSLAPVVIHGIDAKDKDEQYVETKKVTTEDWIFDTILSIEAVQAECEMVKEQSKGERELTVAIYSYPNKKDNFYRVKVWEDNGYAFATHFNFNVYPKSRKILFYDTVNDTLVDLETFEKMEQK